VGLALDAEPRGDAVDVVEVGDEVVGVDDRAVIEAQLSEWREILHTQGRRGVHELLGVAAECGRALGDSFDVTGDDRLRERRVARFAVSASPWWTVQ